MARRLERSPGRTRNVQLRGFRPFAQHNDPYRRDDASNAGALIAAADTARRKRHDAQFSQQRVDIALNTIPFEMQQRGASVLPDRDLRAGRR